MLNMCFKDPAIFDHVYSDECTLIYAKLLGIHIEPIYYRRKTLYTEPQQKFFKPNFNQGWSKTVLLFT